MCAREECVSLCEYTKAQRVTMGSHNGQRLLKIKNRSFYNKLEHLLGVLQCRGSAEKIRYLPSITVIFFLSSE